MSSLIRQPSLSKRRSAGKTLRDKTPRSVHATWMPALDRASPLDLLAQSNAGRLADLIPIRFERMRASPLAFFRGSAIIMAADLARTPSTGILVQSCGDCHLANFGWFATPERNLAFDVTDFDETLPAPWEWDVKRLATSFVLAARDLETKPKVARRLVRIVGRSYRERMREFAKQSALEVWYTRLDIDTLLREARSREQRRSLRTIAKQARKMTVASLIPELTLKDDPFHFRDQPPLVYHAPERDEHRSSIAGLLDVYQKTLSDDRRELLGRFQVADFAFKVVGVGSVGLRCSVALLIDHAQQPFILQLKEARPSVLAPHVAIPFDSKAHQGQRIVLGQRLMQSASDLFLGWTKDEDGRDYYVRQLRDMKLSLNIAQLSPRQARDYAELCGWSLARAHAKSNRAPEIAGYLGKGDEFDRALAAFAEQYADQVERDFQVFQNLRPT